MYYFPLIHVVPLLLATTVCYSRPQFVTRDNSLLHATTARLTSKHTSQERFELPTHALEERCSIQLSY